MKLSAREIDQAFLLADDAEGSVPYPEVDLQGEIPGRSLMDDLFLNRKGEYERLLAQCQRIPIGHFTRTCEKHGVALHERQVCDCETWVRTVEYCPICEWINQDPSLESWLEMYNFRKEEYGFGW